MLFRSLLANPTKDLTSPIPSYPITVFHSKTNSFLIPSPPLPRYLELTRKYSQSLRTILNTTNFYSPLHLRYLQLGWLARCNGTPFLTTTTPTTTFHPQTPANTRKHPQTPANTRRTTNPARSNLAPATPTARRDDVGRGPLLASPTADRHLVAVYPPEAQAQHATYQTTGTTPADLNT